MAYTEGFPEQVPTAAVLAPHTGQEQHTLRNAMGRIAAVGALAGFLALGWERPADAAPTQTVVAQAQPNESNWSRDVPLLLSILTTGGAIAAIRNQTKEKREDRFNAALQGIKGESTGEERGARLRALDLYTKERKYAPEVFRTAVEYLRGRRGGLKILREKHTGNLDEFEQAVMERRNADRSALGLLLVTLPAARQRARRQRLVGHIERIFQKDELRLLGVHRTYLVAENGAIENEFQWLYMLELGDETDFTLQTSEVDSLAWLPLEQFKADCTSDQYVPHGQIYYDTVTSAIESAV